MKVTKDRPKKDKTKIINKMQEILNRYPNKAEACEELFELSQGAVDEKNISSIEDKLKEMASKYKVDYPRFLKAYIYALDDEKKQKTIIENFNVKDLKDIPPEYYYPVKIMKFEGIYDIPSIDFEKRTDDIRNLKRVGHIYFLAQTKLPCLIVGETGTSKELMAKAIHKMSTRSKEPFLEINCGEILESLIASELFGHEKGAFTGAHRKKEGILKKANEGTLFLDELGKMPIHLQASLLKAIEENKIRPVGSEETIDIDVRILAAAQSSDIPESGDGPILPDLLFRLGKPNFIIMPTLQERFIEAGPKRSKAILKEVIRKVLEELNEERIWISDRAMEQLFNRQYEGNYRELKNILARSISIVKDEKRKTIELEDLGKEIDQPKKSEEINFAMLLKEKIKKVQLREIRDYADFVRDWIVEEKIQEIEKSGRNIKSVLSSEGITEEKDYRNLWGKFDIIKKKRGNIKDKFNF